MVFMNYITDNETEKEIIDNTNRAIYNLKRWKKLEDKRSYIIGDIEKGLKLKYPKLTYVSITADSIGLETELHTNHVCRWTSSKDANIPKFKCDIQVKDMPDTAEEFMNMKANIKADKQEIMTAMNYIRFRYNLRNTGE